MAEFSQGKRAVSSNMPLAAIANAALRETEAWSGAHRERTPSAADEPGQRAAAE